MLGVLLKVWAMISINGGLAGNWTVYLEFVWVTVSAWIYRTGCLTGYSVVCLRMNYLASCLLGYLAVYLTGCRTACFIGYFTTGRIFYLISYLFAYRTGVLFDSVMHWLNFYLTSYLVVCVLVFLADSATIGSVMYYLIYYLTYYLMG